MKKEAVIKKVYFITLAGSIFFAAAVFFAPFLKSRSIDENRFIYDVFAPLCHQVSSRCPAVFGFPLAVCWRCLGIYIGFIAGVISYAWVRGFSKLILPKIRSLIIVTLPLLLDALGNFLSLWSTPGWLRAIIGFIWGVILPYYFITGIAELLTTRKSTASDQK